MGCFVELVDVGKGFYIEIGVSAQCLFQTFEQRLLDLLVIVADEDFDWGLRHEL